METEDKDLIQKLRDGRQEVLEGIYLTYRIEFFNWAIRKFGCDIELAKDVYQHAILTLYERVRQGNLTFLTSSVKTYLFSVGKNILLSRLRAEFKKSDENLIEMVSGNFRFELGFDTNMTLEKVERLLTIVGDPCRGILIAYYYEKQSMSQIAERFGLSGSDSAKSIKYKCLQKLKNLFDE
jgi:RNA polymerase sigma-70 factor (ECF subfamily)